MTDSDVEHGFDGTMAHHAVTWIDPASTAAVRLREHVLAGQPWVHTVETTAPVASPGSYHLEPTADGTRVTIQLDQEAQNVLGRLALPVMGLVVPRLVDRYLRQLAGLVEAA